MLIAGIILLLIVLAILYIIDKLEKNTNMSERKVSVLVMLIINFSALCVLLFIPFFNFLGIVYITIIFLFDIGIMFEILVEKIVRK